MVPSERSSLDLSEIKISISVESYDKKNYRNCYIAEKCKISKLSKISIPNFDTIILRHNWIAEELVMLALGLIRISKYLKSPLLLKFHIFIPSVSTFFFLFRLFPTPISSLVRSVDGFFRIVSSPTLLVRTLHYS